MSKPESVERSDSPSRTKAVRTRILIVMLLVVIVVSGLFLLSSLEEPTSEQAVEPAPESVPTQTEPEPEPVCRAEGEFVAGFMSPQADDADTAALLNRMNTDAVTFGGRIVPVDAAEYPDEVADAIGERQAYEYTVTMNWQGAGLADTDRIVQVGETVYGIIQTGDNSVVITESVNGGDVFHSLTRTSADRGNNALIGLPVPQMRTSGETWLPDNSYADVVDGFAQKFVAAYHERGADGFYLAMEMPMTDAAHWDPVTDYYSRQTQLINDVAPGATVLISPYFEGRADRETITPETAALGYQKLLDLHNGTHILVSPQDGVGVDTTSLAADESAAHQVTVEDYFEALHAVEPERLYVTLEAMRPGGGSPDSREPTTRDRVEEQLDATDPYVQGAIGFQWSGPNAMTEIPHIGDGACAAGVNELP